MPRSTRIVTPLTPAQNETRTSPETLYKESEAAEILRTSRLTLRRWRINGTGPRHTKMGKQVLYRASEIEKYIEERTSGNEVNEATKEGK